jgi:gliding motility-associated-like protein
MYKKTTMLLKLRNFYFFIILFFYSIFSFGQLGFCNGSSGAPIFLENFGSGTNYGPALPAGVTNYTFVNSGFPQDGQYTLYNRTNLIPNNWHTSFDRTPDNEPDGINGKCLIVNASNTPGQFYRRTVTGLCSNTRFEFSAWLINIYNSASGACPGSGIPINVTFEIWDETDTILLRSGNTGNIAGTPNPIWNQFGLVFTMPAGQTSVILKMRNNGGGGCGNDLAIDDIMFRACGENSSIINTSSSGNTLTICQNSNITNPNLEVVTSGSISHVYQWQQSNDNINFTDISGENSANFTIPNITSTTYYRVKVAQDITNLNNQFCSTFSDIYSVVIIPSPNAPTSNGDQRICSNQATSLSVSILGGQIVNWYDSPTNGNLLLANSTTYTPTNVGTYYAETVSLLNGCKSNTRTAVTLLPAISVTSSGPTTLCTNTNTAITLVASDVNATLNWTATSTDVTGFSNGSGTSINQTLQYNGTTSGTVTYVVTPILNGCEGNPETIVVTVTPATTINLVFPPITTTYCLNATPEILPTLSSNTTPITGTWSPSVINTSSVGTTTYTFTPQVGSCQNILPYQINITVGNNLSPDFPSTISLCSGEIAPILTNISPNGISGTWSPAVINNLVSGSYTFTPNLGSCTVPQTINVTILESQLESFSYSISGAFTDNQSVTISAIPSGNYNYQLDNGVLQVSNIFENVSPGIHTISVIESNTCGYFLSEEILIINYPNYFTPNNDGINDFWYISGMNIFENWKISIFDRFGKLITQLNASNIAWNGTFNSNELPSTDYWFLIEYQENGISRTFRSHFSLIR